MLTIGLLGGMSWESSLEYYRLINEYTKQTVGASHSAEIIMHSFDFDRVEKLQHAGKWDELTTLMTEKSQNLKNNGADVIVICTNTMHLMASNIEREVGIKVLHIAEATGKKIIENQHDKVLLLGTKFTMKGTFYKDVLNKMGIEVMTPSDDDMDSIHHVIYNELIFGKFTLESKKKYINIINKAAKKGAKGVVLGCTEIPLLIQQEDVSITVYDTMTLHCKAAVDFANKA